MIQLTDAELSDFEHIQRVDELPPHEYGIERGALTGHAFADNGFSMVRDLTDGQDIDADSISEAEAIVFVELRGPSFRPRREN